MPNLVCDIDRKFLASNRLPAPMLPSVARAPFDSDDWLFELKWDGVRAVCLVERDRVVAASRTGRDLAPQFPELHDLARAFRRLPVVVDGEIVSLDSKGRSSFQRLQPRINRVAADAGGRSVPVHFAVFDLLCQGGVDLRDLPLEERKCRLEAVLRAGAGRVLYSKHVVGHGKRLFARARRLGIEGIIAKRRTAPYRSGRSREWLKIKTQLRQEFAIVGWTDPRGSRRHIGALLLAVRDRASWAYAGHVGTGFDGATLAALYKKLRPLETKRPPLASPPKTNAPAHWVRPRLVAEVTFGEWTREGILRQPVYVGLRIDKRPEDCVRE